jgi:predicted DNA-binding ribbon-helix-helix protein
MLKPKEPLTVISARLEHKYVKALARAAEIRGITRSQLLREFAMNVDSFDNFLRSERMEQLDRVMEKSDDMSLWVVDNMPPNMDPIMLEFLGNVMWKAASIAKGRGK